MAETGLKERRYVHLTPPILFTLGYQQTTQTRASAGSLKSSGTTMQRRLESGDGHTSTEGRSRAPSEPASRAPVVAGHAHATREEVGASPRGRDDNFAKLSKPKRHERGDPKAARAMRGQREAPVAAANGAPPHVASAVQRRAPRAAMRACSARGRVLSTQGTQSVLWCDAGAPGRRAKARPHVLRVRDALQCA